jgi:hypothetical protein
MIPRRLSVVLALLACVATLAAQTPATTNQVETGAINGAGFYIEVPAQWNKGLVMYTHGYTVAGERPPTPDWAPLNAAARDYLQQYATPTGRIADPMLAIHTTSDNIVLGSDVTAYETPAALAGTSDRFVARFAEANGHCRFTPSQTAAAFDALLAWAREGKRPAAGEQK